MATFDTVRLPTDAANTGKLEDHAVVDTDKFREVVVLGDPDVRANVAAVINADPTTEFGVVVRDLNTPAIKTSVASIDTKVSTAAKQDTGNTSLASIDGKVSTAAKQDTGNTSLASIDTKLGEVAVSPTANTVLARLKDLLTGIVLAAGSATIGSIAAITTSITPGVAATNLGKAEDAAHTTGDVGVMALAVANEANSTFAADGDYVPIGTDREGSNRVIGNRAHDAVDAGGPVKIGAVAIAYGTNPTAVAAADRTNLYANRAGIPFFLGGHPNIVTIEAAYTAAQTDTAIVTVSSGLKIVVMSCTVVVSAATSVVVGWRVGFGATNTPTTTGVVNTHPGVVALSGSGLGEGNGAGMVGVGADGEDLRITSDVPTSGSLRVRTSYFTIES